ncbi:MAG: hypothetical protein J5932_10770 [Prevotella sp.]|nr:hypothetical protein [Prevotella sp.]
MEENKIPSAESLNGILKTLNELFNSPGGNETAIKYIETVKTFIKEQRMPNDCEIDYYCGLLSIIQDMLKNG